MADDSSLERRYRAFGFLAEISAAVLIVGLGVELVCAIIDEHGKFWSVLANIFVFGGVGGEVLFAHVASTAADALLTGQRRHTAEAYERAAKAELETERMRQKIAPRRVQLEPLLKPPRPSPGDTWPSRFGTRMTTKNRDSLLTRSIVR